MKKLTAFLVVIVLILTCVFAAACFAIPHEHDFGDSYFMYTKCKMFGCLVYGRNESKNTFRNEFVVDFDTEIQAEIDQVYSSLIAAIKSGEADEVVELFAQFDAYLSYVQEQYYIASTWSDVYYYNDDVYQEYTTISKYYYQLVEKYYGVFGEIYDSSCKSKFLEWSGWTDAELKEAAAMGDSYSSENQEKLDEIVANYYSAYDKYSNGQMTETEYNNRVNYYFGEFVSVNNQIAADAKYTGQQNYTDYAYANDYNRDYSPSEVSEMRNYVKQYVGDIFTGMTETFEELWDAGLSTNADVDFWNSLEYAPMLTHNSFADYYALWEDFYETKYDAEEAWEEECYYAKISTKYVGNYFNWLNSTTAGAQEINFYNAANDVFRDGNYFIGTGDGAYTMWIPTFNRAIMFFGNGYATAFTFVHEFGHYYENVYNGNLSLSFDHDETQSQGNEMLFLAWLSQNKGIVNKGYKLVQAYQLVDILSTVLMSTAVDELEQIAYSGNDTYNGKTIPTAQVTIDGDTVTVVEYNKLFQMILETYVDADIISNWLSADYWQVAFDSPCYYISYAMSALISVQIYVEAMTTGLTAARDTYFKLFTFGDSAQFVETATVDGATYKYLKDDATYTEILKWCGLKNAFDQTLYASLQSYFG